MLYIAGFADGTGDHVRWTAHGGIHAYASSYPQVPYQVFFVSLIVLDPLVIVLATAVRREAAWLACGVMAADIAANWAGNWHRILNYPAHLAGNVPWLITLFGMFIFATALPLARAMAARAVPASGKTTSGCRRHCVQRPRQAARGQITQVHSALNRLSRYQVRGVGVEAVPEQASGAHAWHEITPACTSRTRLRAGSGNQ